MVLAIFWLLFVCTKSNRRARGRVGPASCRAATQPPSPPVGRRRKDPPMDYSAYLVPLLLAFTSLFAMGKRVNVYDALTRGAEEGLTVLLRILPALVGLMTAVYMLRASGAMDALGSLLAPVLVRLGIPPETAALLFIRPISGSGALAIGSELMAAHGPDSYVGRVAAVMLGSTETTFYTVAVYFGAAGIRKTRYAIPAALIADLTGFMAAALAVRLFFGAA